MPHAPVTACRTPPAVLGAMLLCCLNLTPHAQAKEEVDAASAEALATLRQAELRKAIAEAERAELLAQLPPSVSRAPAGAVDTRDFGAAGLVKAFDLAQQSAGEVCAALPDDRKTVIHEVASAQGIVAARTVDASLTRLGDDLARQNKTLQLLIDKHTPPGSKARALSPLALTVVPATVKAVADIASRSGSCRQTA